MVNDAYEKKKKNAELSNLADVLTEYRNDIIIASATCRKKH